MKVRPCQSFTTCALNAFWDDCYRLWLLVLSRQIEIWIEHRVHPNDIASTYAVVQARRYRDGLGRARPHTAAVQLRQAK